MGYLLFNDHLATAEAQLVAAVNQLKAAGIVDLVIDMRYNGGGLLDIASELAYMVGPAAATAGTVFERLRFNSKNPFRLTPAQTAVPFHATARGFSVPAGQALPKLGLSRVTVLAGPDTCSASESVVNGAARRRRHGQPGRRHHLRQAVRLLSPGQLRHHLFRDPVPGRQPARFRRLWRRLRADMRGADDFGHALGDAAEARLAAALALRSGGACPTVSKAAGIREKAEAAGAPYLRRSPLREIRLLEPARGG